MESAVGGLDVAGALELGGAPLEDAGALLDGGGALLEAVGALLVDGGALLDEAGTLLEAAEDDTLLEGAGTLLAAAEAVAQCLGSGELGSFLLAQLTVRALPTRRVCEEVTAAATEAVEATTTAKIPTILVRAHRGRLACFGRAAPKCSRLNVTLLQARTGGDVDTRPATQPSGTARAHPGAHETECSVSH
jgi:hypothetical protein